MGPTMSDLGIDRLSVEQRIALAQEIWDSLGDARPVPRLSEERWAEITRRDAELEADPGAGLSWEQVRRDIEARL
jgi:putative addiction module component (TIGR02574 family)